MLVKIMNSLELAGKTVLSVTGTAVSTGVEHTHVLTKVPL